MTTAPRMDPTTGPVMSCDELEVDSLDSELEELSEGVISVWVNVTTDPDTSAVSVGGRGATVNVTAKGLGDHPAVSYTKLHWTPG